MKWITRHGLILSCVILGYFINIRPSAAHVIMCDPTFDPQTTQSVMQTPFEGEIIMLEESETVNQLVMINGQARIASPESIKTTAIDEYMRLSPSGKYLIGLTASSQNTLSLLVIQTGEQITFQLNETEVLALNEVREFPPANNPMVDQQRLQWIAENEFVIRRLDLGQNDFPVFKFQQTFVVTEEPLIISREIRVDFVLNEPKIMGSETPHNLYSPLGRYLVQTAFQTGFTPLSRMIRVVDAQTSEALITLQSTGDSDFLSRGWAKGEQVLLVSKQMIDSESVMEIIALYQVDFTVSPPQLNTTLWDNVERIAGQELSLTPTLLPITISPSGEKVAFKARPLGVYTTSYLITYHLTTGEVTVGCDNMRPQTTYLTTFWSPDERYVGYFDDSRHVLVVMDTDEAGIYSLPLGENDTRFLGWIP